MTWHRVVQKMPLFKGKCPTALCAGETSCGLVSVMQHFGATGYLKHVTGLKIQKEQTCARVHNEIAKRVECVVATEVGNGERVAIDFDKTRFSAAMVHVNAANGFRVVHIVVARDKESVGPCNQIFCLIAQVRDFCFLDLVLVKRGPVSFTRLNILRAIPEGHRDTQINATFLESVDA